MLAVLRENRLDALLEVAKDAHGGEVLAVHPLDNFGVALHTQQLLPVVLHGIHNGCEVEAIAGAHSPTCRGHLVSCEFIFQSQHSPKTRTRARNAPPM